MRLLNVVLTCLMTSGCTSFPKLHPHILSLKNSKCGEYKVVQQTDACNIKYEFVQWHPLEYCEGFFALPPEDIAALREYQKAQCANKKQSDPIVPCE
jgi:hypothetical protein